MSSSMGRGEARVFGSGIMIFQNKRTEGSPGVRPGKEEEEKKKLGMEAVGWAGLG